MKPNDIGMLHPLQHFQLIVYHPLVSLDVLLEDDLNGILVSILLCFSNNAVGTCAQGSAKLVLISSREVRHGLVESLFTERTSYRNCLAGLGAY